MDRGWTLDHQFRCRLDLSLAVKIISASSMWACYGSLICERGDFFKGPKMIAYSGCHRRRASDGLADARKVVVHEMKRNRMLVIREFLAVRVG